METFDKFDFDTYWWIVQKLSRTNRPVRFSDLRNGFPLEPFFILRHDVDYSIAAALRLAEQESRRGVQATYFLLLNSFYYNLLSGDHAAIPRRLISLGHEVGLHYDLSFFQAFPNDQWEKLLAWQTSLLGQLSGEPVVSIAIHQPALNGQDPFRHRSDFLNAYDDRFFLEMAYLSDSCRAWRDSALKFLESEPPPQRLQLLLHPINWSESDRGRAAIFNGVHEELVQSIKSAGQDLLGKISHHTGVLEHEARLRRHLNGGANDRT
jgi:hypothetical protein